MKQPRVGVIIPAYNEAEVIKNVISGIPKSLKYGSIIYSVVPIVVDDGSTDATSTIAGAVDCILITHIVNSGAGAATRTGLRYLREKNFDYGATMDGDGQHSPEDLKTALYAAFESKGDFIIGSRLINSTGMPWYKVIGNKGLNLITMVLLGVGSSDSQSGLKAFNRNTIDKLSYRENGYAFCSEMLWRAQRSKLKIAEVPITAVYTDYSKAKGQSNWNAFQIIKQLVKHRLADLVQ